MSIKKACKSNKKKSAVILKSHAIIKGKNKKQPFRRFYGFRMNSRRFINIKASIICNTSEEINLKNYPINPIPKIIVDKPANEEQKKKQ